MRNYAKIAIVITSFMLVMFYWAYITILSKVNININQCDTNLTNKEEFINEIQEFFSYIDTQVNINQNRASVDLAELKEKVQQIFNLVNTNYEKNSQFSYPEVNFACPEKFLGAVKGDPHFIEGTWKRVECNPILPFHQTITIVLFSTSSNFCSVQLPKILNGTKSVNAQINIRVAVKENSECGENFGDVKLLKVKKEEDVGKTWNKLIENVNTPFTLIGRDLDDFNWFTRLERQVSVFNTNPRIKIVGGSIRNESGHWQIGCYQIQLTNYILEYKDGYYSSRNECMFCDHLLGPFVARTDFLKQVKFNENISENIVFEEFFLRIKNNFNFVMNCPDAMYMSTDPGIIARTSKRLSWIWLVRKIQLNRIVLPDDVVHKYSCTEASVSCKKLFLTANSLMMPICCMDAAAHGLKKFHEICLKNNITYQLTSGSALGAVKFRDIIPWDFDGDGFYYVLNQSFFANPLNLSDDDGEVLIDHQNEKKDGFFKISSDGFFTEMWAVDKLAGDVSGLGELFSKTPSLMRIRGVWVYGPPNPGLYARNMYGVEMLKHANSWFNLGHKWWYAPYEVVDKFLPCRHPNHHACIDQFGNDGNIQFNFP